ncbi:MAG: WxcM-like domain-containing protein [Clostridium fessum]
MFLFRLKEFITYRKCREECRRGFHSHRDLHQALICVHGTVKKF